MVTARSGFLFGLAAYLCWGAFPIFFSLLAEVDPFQIIPFRVASAMLFCVVLVSVLRAWGPVGRILRAMFRNPLVIGSGPKGATVRRLADCAGGPAAFVDDLLSNLDSVAAEAPAVHRFQMVADPRLRPMAPAAPDRHEREDEWSALGERLLEVLR